LFYGRFGYGGYYGNFYGNYYGGIYGAGGFGRFGGYGFYDRRYDRQVALLLRDKRSNEALYEAHASNDGATTGDPQLMGALFEAALADFPKTNPKSHRVAVQAIR